MTLMTCMCYFCFGQILIHGDQESTDSLAEFCRTQGVVQGKVFTPKVMEIVDATTESHIYQVKLKDSLVSALEFSKARDAELAWVDGQLDFSHARTDTTAMTGEDEETENEGNGLDRAEKRGSENLPRRWTHSWKILEYQFLIISSMSTFYKEMCSV